MKDTFNACFSFPKYQTIEHQDVKIVTLYIVLNFTVFLQQP
jgi:hypothetical protein